jgi:hypothetical protein
MKGKIIKDWSKVGFVQSPLNGQLVIAPADRPKVIGALQHFMRLPDGLGGFSGRDKSPIAKAIQFFATKGDFPAEILQILEKYHATPSYDLGYEQVFEVRDFTGTTAGGFKIQSVSSGLTFGKVKTGEKALVYKFGGTVAEVSFDKYGGGLDWDRTLMDDRQYWTLEDNAIEFRNKAYSDRASIFYALIEAAGAASGNKQSWAAVTPASVATSNENYNAIRDVNTIVAAINAILADLKDDGVGATAQSTFTIVAPVALMGRMQRALTLLNQPVVGSLKQQPFNVNVVYTLMLASNSYYYVCFPKAKCKAGYRMDLTIFDQFDLLSYSDTMVGWMRYGGAVGDTDQIAQCAIS